MATFDPATGVITSTRTLTPKQYINAQLDTGHTHGELLPSVPNYAPGGGALTQATGNKQPMYSVDADGRPWYYCDGVGTVFKGSASAGHDWGQMFWGMKPVNDISTAVGQGVPVAIGAFQGGFTEGYNLGSSTGALTNEVVTVQWPQGARSSWQQSGTVMTAGSKNIIGTKWTAVEVRYRIRHNGGTDRASQGTGTPVLITNESQLTIGGSPNNEFYSPHYVDFFIVYTQADLTDEERAAVNSYYADTRGITVADYDPNWAGVTEQNEAGGGEATIEIQATGGGEGGETAEGGGETTIEIQATGGGDATEVSASGAEATIEIQATGGGEATELVESGSETTLEIQATGGGAGTEAAEGGGETTIEIIAVGGGSSDEMQVSDGGGTATIEIQAVGGGDATEAASSGAETSLEIQATGAGDAFEAADSGAETSLEIQSITAWLAIETAEGGGETTVEIEAIGGSGLTGPSYPPHAGTANLLYEPVPTATLLGGEGSATLLPEPTPTAVLIPERSPTAILVDEPAATAVLID